MFVPYLTPESGTDPALSSKELLAILSKYALVSDPIFKPASVQALPEAALYSRDIPQLSVALPTDLPVSSILDAARDLLDDSVACIVIDYSPAVGRSATDFASSILSKLPADRVVVSLALDESGTNEKWLCSTIEAFASAVSGFIVVMHTSVSPVELPDEQLSQSHQLNRKFIAGTIGHIGALYKKTPSLTRKLTLSLPNQLLSIPLISALNAREINLLAPHRQLSPIDLGEAYASCLITDRSDGLFSTVVVDEHGVALGLAYSSVQSISEAIKTRQGVYQSRTRGLWYKGLTSGATQALLRIDADCDRDCVRFIVRQNGPGYCHLNTRTCFGPDSGITALAELLEARKASAPEGSYTKRLFNDPLLLRSKIMEEAEELCDAATPEDIAWEAADLIYFALARCISQGVSLRDVEANLDRKARKISRRSGDAKPKWDFTKPPADSGASKPDVSTETPQAPRAPQAPAAVPEPLVTPEQPAIAMKKYTLSALSKSEQADLLIRPIFKTDEIMARVRPIVESVSQQGDRALLDYTAKFDGVKLDSPVLRAPFAPELMSISETVRSAIDMAYSNVEKFHAAQLDTTVLTVETMPGVVCSRFVRPIERVGLYVPGGSAVLPSTTLMLGVPAKVAGCREIVVATPPRKDGSICPEVVYVAHKIGASVILAAGGAQAVAAMAYGTESVPKVDKICGPGNQYVTCAKMIVQNDTSAMVAIDMPAGPSELLVIADMSCNPAYVASDLLSQAEHGPDSQVVLLAVALTTEKLAQIEAEVASQGAALPRAEIVRISIPKSYIAQLATVEEALDFSNRYAPEHLILHLDDAEKYVELVENAGSVFVGPYSPESCGDYASGTNHTLPTYGFAKMYSGVNTGTFVKHITSQCLTKQGLDRLGDCVTTLAEIEGLEAHRNAVAIRLKDIRQQ